MKSNLSMTNQKQKNEDPQRLVISLGDPAGIGTEVTLKALASSVGFQKIQPILVGCKKHIYLTYSKLQSLGVSKLINPQSLEIQDIPIKENISLGQPTASSGEASFKFLTHAVNLIQEGKAKALVTAPIAKYVWHEAGYIYPGQTERIAELTGSEKVSMLFTAVSPKTEWRFNILLATTHIPLNTVSNALTPALINSKLDTLLKFCKRFQKHPTICVAGLNPHAGEEGKLGEEEITWLIPTLMDWKSKHPEVCLKGPISPDTFWIPAAKSWCQAHESSDGFLALYHDQGLIPMKLIAFDEAVNTTLGLPFIRTSPDHGTGFDIANDGIAKPDSMLAAIKTAWELSK